MGGGVKIDPMKLLQSRAVILANSGGGKSHTIRRFAEGACEETQTIIMDPEGEFSSLREKFDFILAGKDKDVPVEIRSAALLATKLLELGKSAVIDLYELHPQDRQRYVKLFFDAIVNCPKNLYHPVFIVLDEAHEFAPEGKPSEATWAVEALASKGRKRGFCLIPASQRISKLSKNVSAECNNKLIGRASQDIDMKRAGDELGFTKDRLVELRQLKPGEFFAFGPAISDDVIKVKIGDVQTSHAKVGYKGNKKTPPASAVIKKVLGALADLPQEAEKEAKTVAELKKENADLKRQNTTLLKHPYQYDLDMNDVSPYVDKAVKSRDEQWKNLLKLWKDYVMFTTGIFEELSLKVTKLDKMSLPDFPDAWEILGYRLNDIVPKRSSREVIVMKPLKDIRPGQLVTSEDVAPLDFVLSKSQQKILNMIHWFETAGFEAISRNQVALAVGVQPTSGGYNNNLSIMKTGGVISYPSAGLLALTDKGRMMSYASDRAPSTEELHDKIKEMISTSQWNILETLIKIYPEPLSREDLAYRINVQPTSGGYGNNLSILRTLGLIDYPTQGMVVALSVLFIGRISNH